MNNSDISKAICDAYKTTISERSDGKGGISKAKSTPDGIAKVKDIQKAFFEGVLNKDYSKLVEESKKLNGEVPLEKELSSDLMDIYTRNIK